MGDENTRIDDDAVQHTRHHDFQGGAKATDMAVQTLTDDTDGQAWETLHEAGFQTGDFLPIKTFSARKGSNSTTSSSPTMAWNVNEFLAVSDRFPGTLAFKADFRTNANGDTANTDLWNNTDSETVPGTSMSNTSGGWANTEAGPLEYTPPTTGTPVTFAPRLWNDDGTTNVSISVAQVSLGTIL